MLLPHYPVTTKTTTTNTLGTHPVEFAGIEIEKKKQRRSPSLFLSLLSLFLRLCASVS